MVGHSWQIKVEGMKTFLQLLLLLLTLFGYHVAGNGFVVPDHMEHLYLSITHYLGTILAFNPVFISSMVVLLPAPLIQCLPNVYKFSPNLLKTIGIGFMFHVLQYLIYMVLLALTVLETGLYNLTHFCVRDSMTNSGPM